MEGVIIDRAGIELIEGATVELKDVKAGPCVRCHVGEAIFLDGIYSVKDDLLELVSGPNATRDTLRRLGLVLVRAAREGTDPDKLGRQLQGRLPRFIAWMKREAFSKPARKRIFAWLAGTVATIVLTHYLENSLWPPHPETIINEYYQPTVEKCAERLDAETSREQATRLNELERLLKPPNPDHPP